MIEEKRGTGKWREPGVPHKGWTCVDVIDVVEERGSFVECEMCEVAIIRYVHVMEHPDYSEELRVGCICAGHMEQDLIGARHRETTFKNVRQRIKRWLTREWHTSAKGNVYINVDGCNVVVFKKGALWSGRVAERASDKVHFLRSWFADSDAAKLGVLRMLEQIKRA